jgi:hypothetical protein
MKASLCGPSAFPHFSQELLISNAIEPELLFTRFAADQFSPRYSESARANAH